jgi:quinol monooxygenase YgiN
VPGEVEPTIVTMRFDAIHPEPLVAALARYVVLSRGHPGCRNIDLCQSVGEPNQFVVIEKWESPSAQRAHLDSAEFTDLAAACEGVLRARPDIELLDGLSAHDLA